MSRKTTAIYALALTAPLALLCVWLTTVHLLAGWAAITVALTAALVIKPD